MTRSLASPPDSICILRLSAIGDICHTLPVVRTIQSHWPTTRITWVIGKLEASLVSDIPDIEFIIFDKSKGLKAYLNLYRTLQQRRFDILLHMQMSIRASLASLMIRADLRVGFDRRRAKDLQWLFTNRKIPARINQHVVDSLFGFAEALGIQERLLGWDIPLPDAAHRHASALLPDKAFIVISPCSSMAYRNWTVSGYCAVADYAFEKHGLTTVLTGGPSSLEISYGQEISRACRNPPVNLIGKTGLKELLVVLGKARLVIAPDSGPAHLSTAVGTPVIGLYAATNPNRAGPYLSAQWVVNRYPDAIKAKFGKQVAELPWGTRVRDPGTMALITAEDVQGKLDELMRST